MKRYLKLFSSILLLSYNSFATKYYVNDASTTGDVFCTAVGNGANNGLSPSTPKLTLASVLTTYAASFVAGDTIFIDAGSYTEIQLSSPINGVVIQGAGLTKTLITKSGSDRYFMLINDNNTVLSDMKLSGYDNQTVSGVQALGIDANTTGVKIINVQVDGCATSSDLGGYPIEVASGASVLFSGGGVTCNTWDAGGGMQISGATTTVTIQNYQFIGNYQLWSNGTALKINNGIVDIYNSRFESNTIGGDKTGMAIDVTTGTVNVYDSYFYNNLTNILSNNVGGAVSIHGGTFRITRSIFSNNKPEPATSGIYGAGIGVTAGTVTIDSCGFSGNVGARANDVYVKGGTVLSRNCTFGSAANQIGIAGGTFSISTCGSPTEYGAGIVHINTTSPSYTANPSLPDYLPITCVSLPCTTPTITSSAPTNTICSGGTFTTNLSATTSSAQTTYSWTSSSVIGITGHSTSGTGNINETLTNTSASTLTVSYSVTPVFNTSCNGPTVVYTVSVYPTTTVSASSSTICSGNTATITPGGGTSYTLNPGALTGSSFTISPSSTTTYTLSGLATNGCSAVSSTVSVKVNSTPTVSLSANNNTICSNNSVILTPSGALTYTLNPGHLTGTGFTLTPNTTTTYSVVGTSSLNCISTNTASTIVTVNTTPTVGLSANTNTICSNNSVVLTPSGASTYTLNPGNLTGSSFTLSPSTTTTYSVVGTSSLNCISSNTGTTTITVNPTPTVSFSSINSSTICTGQSAVITPTGASTYTLLPDNLSGSSFTLSPGSNTTYTLSGTSAAGCLSANSATATIIVNITPTINIPDMTNTICSGQSITIDGNALPVPAVSYTLQPGNLNGTSFTVTPGSTTTYSLTGTSAEGCVSSNSATITITVYTTPTVVASSIGSQTICSSETVTLTASGADGFGWLPTGDIGTTYTATPTTNTTYTVIGQNMPGACRDTTLITITVNATPTLNIPTNNLSLCSGNPLVLPPVTGGSIVNWNGPNSYTSSVSSPTVTNSITSGDAGTYSVSVSETYGSQTCTSAVSEVTVAVVLSASVQASNADVCLGSTTTITPTGANSYTLIPGNSSGLSFTLNPTTNTTYTLQGSAGTGCDGTTTFSIQVNPLPNVIATATPTDICSGNTSTLSVAGADQYQWDSNAGSSTNPDVSVSPNTTTTYSVIGTYSLTGCSNSSTIQINVTTTPTVNVASSQASVCAGSSATLTLSGASSYTVTDPPTNSNGTTVITPTSTTTYTITGNNGNCESQPETITIYYNDLPVLSINNSTICSGNTATLIANGADSYVWNPGGMTSSTVTVTPNNSTTYSVVGTNSITGCTSTLTTVDLTVNPTPVANATANPNTVCSSGTVNLNGSSTVSGSTYTWSTGNGINSTNQNQQNISFSAAGLNTGSYTYTLTVSSPEGCVSAATTASVQIISLPNSSFSLSPLSICQNSNASLTIDSPQSGTTYDWNIGGVSVNNSNPVNIPSTITSTPGTYSVTVVAAIGTCSNSSTETLTVNILPTVSLINNNITDCPGTDVHIDIASPVNSYTYSWSYNNTSIGNGNSISISSIGNGNTGIYLITVTDTLGCVASTTAVVNTKNCEIFIPEIFTPNGDGKNDTFVIKHIEDYPNNDLKIFNRWGNLVYEKKGYNNEFDGHANVNDAVGSDKLPVGTYYVVLEFNDGKTETYKGYLQLQY